MPAECSDRGSAIVQAAGHGLLRVDPDRPGAVVKPTTRQECVTYECLRHDPSAAPLLEFVPRYFDSWPLAGAAAGSKFTHEVSLENLCRLRDACVMRWRARIDPDGAQCGDEGEGEGDTGVGGDTGDAVTVFQSAPSVMDLKLGRFRHTKATSVRKYMRMWRKDGPTTARTVGMRCCGVKHSRLVADSVAAALATAGDAASRSEERAERRRRRAVEREKAARRGDSDSEIMQLPRTAELAEQLARAQSGPPASCTASDDTVVAAAPLEADDVSVLTWSEDKSFGRAADAEQLVEAVAMFCTVRVAASAPTGRARVCAEDRSAAQRFEPAPEPALVAFYLARVTALLAAIERHGLLERYSFASASVLLVQRWSVQRCQLPALATAASETPAQPRFAHYFCVEADLRLVDFSSSGTLDSATHELGAASNPKISAPPPLPRLLPLLGAASDESMPRAQSSWSPSPSFESPPASPASSAASPTSPASPAVSAPVIPVTRADQLFADDAIEFRFGLANLGAALQQIAAATKLLAERKRAALRSDLDATN
jgi:hypothetical protein